MSKFHVINLIALPKTRRCDENDRLMALAKMFPQDQFFIFMHAQKKGKKNG
jgi:hypothetical protein